MKFLEAYFRLQLHLQMFHWQSPRFSQHKTMQELRESLDQHVDEFVEVYQGLVGRRIRWSSSSCLIPVGNTSLTCIRKEIKTFLRFLSSPDSDSWLPQDSSLLNIRDEIMADLQQGLYLLTFL